MIIKIRRGSSRSISNTITRIKLQSVEEKWVKCIYPFSRSTFNIDIGDGVPIKISSSSFMDIINDERVNYNYCNFCGNIQKKNIDACMICDHGNKGFEQLISDDLSFSFSTWGVVKSVFGI